MIPHAPSPLGMAVSPSYQRLDYITATGVYQEKNHISLPTRFSDWPATRFELDFQIVSKGSLEWNHLIGAFGKDAVACAVVQQEHASNSWAAVIRTDKNETVDKKAISIQPGNRYRLVLTATEYSLWKSPGGVPVTMIQLSTGAMQAGIDIGTPYIDLGHGHIIRYYEAFFSDTTHHYHLQPARELKTGLHGMLDTRHGHFLTGVYPERITGA